MVLPYSGSMTLSAIMTEFGASLSRALSAMYRNGSFVPDTVANASVPTSGSMTASTFYGGCSCDWANISALGTLGQNLNVPVKSAITIKVTFTGSGLLFYRVNSGTYTNIGSGGTFAVSANDTVNFRVTGVAVSGTVSVLNNSHSDAILDTFDYSLS